MAFKLRSGNKPEFKNMGSSPAMQKSKDKPKKQEDFNPAYPGADYSQEQIDKMTEDGYEPKKETTGKLLDKAINKTENKTNKPGKLGKITIAKQEMTLEERRAKHKADNKKKTDVAVEKHKKAMRKKQLKANKQRGTVFIDKKTGEVVKM